MKEVFADTFYFLALVNPSDQAHARADEAAKEPTWRMVTTAFVLAELGDGLAEHVNRVLFLELLDLLKADRDTVIVPPTQELFDAGVTLYRGRPDKDWSLTDCISFVTMEERGIREALTGDHHFEQAGFVALLK
ncbi:MAG: type II toxin-antitoxin system VapC family toxin [Acidobacteria bacterium]|nr:type II toxin-antitoxin system VapC family toxin [Acidobacteriota bacterium]